MGDWLTLMSDLHTAQYYADVIAAAAYRGTVGSDGETTALRHQQATNKMQAGDIAGATNALLVQPTIGGGDNYAAQVTDLVASPITSEEEQRYDAAMKRANELQSHRDSNRR